MKGLQKLALAAAISAAPFAQAMESLDDSLLDGMTGQAGITIDVDLDMTISAIKYVDRDGNGTGDQGAITISGITVDNNGGTATIRGVTIDVDGNQGIVIGLEQIGTTAGDGIDINVDAVIINNGNANLNAVTAVNAATYNNVAASLNYAAYATGTAQTTVISSFDGTQVGTYAAGIVDAQAQAVGYPDAATLQGALASADPAVAGQAAGAVVAIAGAALSAGDTAPATLALADEAQDLGTLQTVGAELASAGNGNIGGFKIENFRNYIQNDLVEEYNGVFDMALKDSAGVVTGNVASVATGGRFVRGEIVINGTGNAAQGTSGLNISGSFGGAMDEAAWVDEGKEFGIADLGFFNGVDTDGDSIADTIEGMHFEMNIDVVDHESWNNATPGTADVAALQISGLKMEGTIMMGSLYLDSTTASVNRQSLGSVLIKDIDMTGTSLYIYGH